MTSSSDRPNHISRSTAAFVRGEATFIAGALPEEVLALDAADTLGVLRQRLGDAAVDAALGPGVIPGPMDHQPDGGWIRSANIVGINVRTIGSFWNVVKYTLTLPAAQDAIHLLPIWEPGVVESLYGICSWELNDEFFDADLAGALPHLDNTAGQLRVVVNLLHAGGRTVGMDVIPHTDRYSQMSLAFPEHFEWLRREGMRIVDHRSDLHEEVHDHIVAFLVDNGPALREEPTPASPDQLFGEDVDEARRLRLLFGSPRDSQGREARRVALVKHLHHLGYEPVPATMGPPYRGIEVDPDQAACTTDAQGMVWRDYRITAPQEFSRAFGPLARYKLYERLDDNRHWQIDFDRPRESVWRYVCQRYGEVQQRFGFDFMRGDMSHVQPRPAGVPEVIDERYDLLMAVKRHVRDKLGVPHFAYFAESFLAPPDTMAYGDEVEHLEASEAEITLGNLQSMTVGGDEFLSELRRYIELGHHRRVTPCFTVITADKDDPRFDSHFVHGNALRMFLALLLPDLPSYVALGFETRDVHLKPAPNEHYTKLYVFQESSGPKATSGPYVWGTNEKLFDAVTRIRWCADGILPRTRRGTTRWLLPPDPRRDSKVLSWTLDGDPSYLLVANADVEHAGHEIEIPLVTLGRPDLLFAVGEDGGELRRTDRALTLERIPAGGCRIYSFRG